MGHGVEEMWKTHNSAALDIKRSASSRVVNIILATAEAFSPVIFFFFNSRRSNSNNNTRKLNGFIGFQCTGFGYKYYIETF